MRRDVTDRAAILTGGGAAALAVVRLAGPGVMRFCARYLSRSPVASRAVHVELRDEAGAVIDDPVAVLAANEAYLDLSLHGGAWVVESTVALLRRSGFGIVEGSTLLELDHDAIERDVVRAVPRATTELACRCLLAQVEAWRPIAGDWDRFWTDPAYRVARLVASERKRITADRALWRLMNPPTVAIVGRANVGKSSLANRLLAQDRSIVADLAGTTRDWVGETADLEGLPVTLVDTPGVRETDDPIERAAIEHSGRVVGSADLVIVVLDATSPPDPSFASQFPGAVVVSNKVDRSGAVVHAETIATSAVTGQGLDRLVETILRRIGVYQIDVRRPRLWMEEQFAALAGEEPSPWPPP